MAESIDQAKLKAFLKLAGLVDERYSGSVTVTAKTSTGMSSPSTARISAPCQRLHRSTIVSRCAGVFSHWRSACASCALIDRSILSSHLAASSTMRAWS